MIYPTNFEEKIGFNDIRAMVKARCASGYAREKVDGMDFTSRHDEVVVRIDRVVEFMSIIDGDDSFPDGHYCDTREQLHKVRVEGAWMDEGELFDLRRSLQTIGEVVSFFSREEKAAAYPALAAMSEGVATFPAIVRDIDRIIDKYGHIRDNASPGLARIRHELES
ncbi:MAG TPA: endonuclease MutS2, partial [Candidatus Avibacteroides faecavium]|nr:endonuclease MutS2 [Candidatus Avibacteroides faecavium]